MGRSLGEQGQHSDSLEASNPPTLSLERSEGSSCRSISSPEGEPALLPEDPSPLRSSRIGCLSQWANCLIDLFPQNLYPAVMLCEHKDEFAELLPKKGRLLGLDLGTKTIGLALSDSNWQVSSAIETIRRTKFTKDLEALKALIAERGVKGLVLGLPVNMDGSEGPRCQSTRQFASNLEKMGELDLPILLWDERLSTSAVQRFLIDEVDMNRKRRKEVVDKMAAGYILEGALTALNRGN